MPPQPHAPAWRRHFHGPLFWTGVAFATLGCLAETLIDGRMAFESLLLFGGLYIGIAFERNRQASSAAITQGSEGVTAPAPPPEELPTSP